MSGIQSISGIESTTSAISANNVQNNISNDNDESIFAPTKTGVEELSSKLDEVVDKNGFISTTWNDFKETVNIGSSEKKCDEVIEKYKNGEISYEEAYETIENYGKRQESFTNLASNIGASIAGIGAAALVVASGGTAAPVALALVGAGAGAVTKAGTKLAERATNKVEGDELDAKEIIKDGLSGAVTGGVAVATAGTGANTFETGFTIGNVSLEGTAACAAKSAQTGLITGAISGSSNYVIDCTFDEEKDFKAGELVGTTVESSIIGGTVGGLMGTSTGALRSSGVLNAADNNILANATSTASYKVTNDRIHATSEVIEDSFNNAA